MSENKPTLPELHPARTGHYLKTLGIVVIACIISTLLALWVMYSYFLPNELQPVVLNTEEAARLEGKLSQLEASRLSKPSHNKQLDHVNQPSLQPEAYSEPGASREVILTEREMNALLASNSDLANRMAIDFSEDLASAKLLIPLNDEVPVLGGKTLLLTLGFELSFIHGKPIVIFKGASLWGIPVPTAWVGNIKNVDLVQKFGNEEGFWKTFAAGIDDIEVSEGQLRIRLKE